LLTNIGMEVANPAYDSNTTNIEILHRAAYHGTVIWSFQQGLMAGGLARQLGFCLEKRRDAAVDTNATPTVIPAWRSDAEFLQKLQEAERRLWNSIKGAPQNHLVTFICKLIIKNHGKAAGQRIIKDIDRRISTVPDFPGIRWFHDGRDFAQWTGDDSKALMKVYIAAINGYLDPKVVRCLSSFLEMCYIARKNTITESDLARFDAQLERFRDNRTVFLVPGVRDNFDLPRQHALEHFVIAISRFGAPNGHCSSITESKHIIAVKQPWRRSSRNNALPQMLCTIHCTDELEALCRKFAERGMLRGSTSSFSLALLMGATIQNDTNISEAVEFEFGDLGPSHGPKEDVSVRLPATPGITTTQYQYLFFNVFLQLEAIPVAIWKNLPSKSTYQPFHGSCGNTSTKHNSPTTLIY
ncbi:hypothetical protein MPER_04215, partial [Moniliophthora perniciosa FA553]